MSMLPTKEQMPQMVQGSLAYATAAPAAPQGGSGLTGRDILRIIRRRKWWIIVSVMVSTIISVMGTAAWIYFAPRYEAYAFLRVQLPKTSVINLQRQMFVAEEMNRTLC